MPDAGSSKDGCAGRARRGRNQRNSPPAASCGRGAFEVADDAMEAGAARATSLLFLVVD